VAVAAATLVLVATQPTLAAAMEAQELYSLASQTGVFLDTMQAVAVDQEIVCPAVLQAQAAAALVVREVEVLMVLLVRLDLGL
jgi:hypothetical protein